MMKINLEILPKSLFFKNVLYYFGMQEILGYRSLSRNFHFSVNEIIEFEIICLKDKI